MVCTDLFVIILVIDLGKTLEYLLWIFSIVLLHFSLNSQILPVSCFIFLYIYIYILFASSLLFILHDCNLTEINLNSFCGAVVWQIQITQSWLRCMISTRTKVWTSDNFSTFILNNSLMRVVSVCRFPFSKI